MERFPDYIYVYHRKYFKSTLIDFIKYFRLSFRGFIIFWCVIRLVETMKIMIE